LGWRGFVFAQPLTLTIRKSRNLVVDQKRWCFFFFLAGSGHQGKLVVCAKAGPPPRCRIKRGQKVGKQSINGASPEGVPPAPELLAGENFPFIPFRLCPGTPPPPGFQHFSPPEGGQERRRRAAGNERAITGCPATMGCLRSGLPPVGGAEIGRRSAAGGPARRKKKTKNPSFAQRAGAQCVAFQMARPQIFCFFFLILGVIEAKSRVRKQPSARPGCECRPRAPTQL